MQTRQKIKQYSSTNVKNSSRLTLIDRDCWTDSQGNETQR